MDNQSEKERWSRAEPRAGVMAGLVFIGAWAWTEPRVFAAAVAAHAALGAGLVLQGAVAYAARRREEAKACGAKVRGAASERRSELGRRVRERLGAERRVGEPLLAV